MEFERYAIDYKSELHVFNVRGWNVILCKKKYVKNSCTFPLEDK